MLVDYAFSDKPIEYEYALEYMEKTVHKIIAGAQSVIWFLEHPPIYTAGSSAKAQDLLMPNRFPVYESGRGGQYTYHGPGQRVVYLMLNLKQLYETPDIHHFVESLEFWVIGALGKVGLKAVANQERVGIWVKDERREDKIAAIGIRVKKWITYHGIAINVIPDLEHFSGIVPCGLRDYGVTSLKEKGIDITAQEFDDILLTEFTGVFNVSINKRYEV